MVAGLYMSLLPEAGGELAVLHAQDTGYGINPGSPPPALVCRIAKSSDLTESILKKESHALQDTKSFERYSNVRTFILF
ncbi:MAG: hypothetical protein JRJ69_07250 [Deltaproteobacteria bacterium]|nr:hypothetical protein [Deltaproteobacteria bacterium]